MQIVRPSTCPERDKAKRRQKTKKGNAKLTQQILKEKIKPLATASSTQVPPPTPTTKKADKEQKNQRKKKCSLWNLICHKFKLSLVNKIV